MSETNAIAVRTDRRAATAQIVRWIIEGASESDIVEAIEAKFPGNKPAPLIVAAVKRLEESAETSRYLAKGFAIEATRDIYRRALEIGDHQTALRAIKQLHELAGDE
jgi:hypothetical protein